MKFRNFILGGCFLTLALSFGALKVRAQDAPQEPPDSKPKPAARSYPIPIDWDNQQDQNNAQDPTGGLRPDNTPLTGVQNATLGSPEMRHSYWVPGVQYSSSIQSNGSTGWLVSNYLIGNISLLKAWSRSQLAVNYSGGGFFSSDSGQGNGYYHELALTQTLQWNRWLVQILDQFSYLPQSQFGFGGGTNLGVPGVGGSIGPVIPGLGNNYVPNQSNFAAVGPRYSNAAAVEVTYSTSPRGSITTSGSYEILRFVDPGNIDTSTPIGSLGYNYALSRESTVGIVYRFSGFHFQRQPQAFGSHVVAAVYSRKLTGRLALQLSGGPEITTFRVPIHTQSGQVGGNVNANFMYAFRNGGLRAGYEHGLTGGSGVFTGSTVDMVNFTADRKLSRVWNASFNFGYAHNKAIGNSTQSVFPTNNSWYAGGGVSRPFGRNLNFAVSYTANINRSNQFGCTGAACNSSQTSHFITVNLQWHPRPFVLE